MEYALYVDKVHNEEVSQVLKQSTPENQSRWLDYEFKASIDPRRHLINELIESSSYLYTYYDVIDTEYDIVEIAIHNKCDSDGALP